jgi:hypothetical protein
MPITSKLIKITETFTDLDSALAAAKLAGNWIFEGYENNIASRRASDKRCGVIEYHLTDKADILYIAEFDTRKCLNKVQLTIGLNNSALAVAHRLNEGFKMVPKLLISKSDYVGIKRACSMGMLLVDQSVAYELSN